MDAQGTTTLVDRLLQLRDEDEEKEAFVFYNSAFERSSITRNELVQLASRFAYVLKSSGIGYRDAVVNTVPNSLERLVTDMGIIMAGAAPVNSIPALTTGEIFFSTARRSEAKAVVVYPGASENSDWLLLKDGIHGSVSLDKGVLGNGVKESGEESMGEVNRKHDAFEESVTYGKFVLDYRSEQAPKMAKAIVLSRRTDWQCENIPTVPHFIDFLRSLGEEQMFIERQVVSSDVGYYHTTTGTTGMQKIVPRLHSSLLKVAEVVGQMAPCRLPILFVTLSLGWNSGFPFMFFHFGSICVMIDNLDLANGGMKNTGHQNLDKKVQEQQRNGHHTNSCSSKTSPVEKSDGLSQGFELNRFKVVENGRDCDGLNHVTKNDTKNTDLASSDSIYEVYWHAIDTESIPFAHLSPTEIDGMARINKRVETHGQQPSSRMAFVVTGGLPIKQSTVSCALESVCQNLVVFYGMTEAGVLSYNVVSSAEDYTEGQCGRLYRGVQCRITDDLGNVLPAGQTGNIEFKTETMFNGFLRNVEKTKQAFTPDGWFVTADLGFFKDDDTLTVLCRRDDVILHGSVLIYPTAIEAVLRRCPGVNDVVVVPVPDRLKHQNVCACVIRAPGETFSEQDLKNKMDAMLAFPRNVEIQTPQHVVFMDNFPLVQNAKINRKLLAQIATESISHLH
ncbi:4-coumarate--CoA ligase-like 4 [Elysia marginata]|uniref:Medium-chain acyl-CoA ligase ACSF2, mitochondrial n=1 Tax=Elysia marginata TaxID=1093978 RepID=A0AAV4EPB8_9GAST|nr:4-coumarate--CoA ligase-like 4 [Elysia marginata]